MIAPISHREVRLPQLASHMMNMFTRPQEFVDNRATSAPRLLVVEDDAILRRLLTMVLERENYHVIAVANGAEAIATFVQHEFSLVLMDIMMPVMDGFSACAHIRSLSSVPIILLSALGSMDVKTKALNSGASCFLNKPIRPQELKQQLQYFLCQTS